MAQIYYRIADLHNGPFSDEYKTLPEAEKALAENIVEGEKCNVESFGNTAGSDGIEASDFFCIQTFYEVEKGDKDGLRHYFNCEEAEVDEDGDVWISGPMTGHWIDDERKQAFCEWATQFDSDAILKNVNPNMRLFMKQKETG